MQSCPLQRPIKVLVKSQEKSSDVRKTTNTGIGLKREEKM